MLKGLRRKSAGMTVLHVLQKTSRGNVNVLDYTYTKKRRIEELGQCSKVGDTERQNLS